MSFSIILHTLINSKNMFTILLIIDTDNKNTMMLCPFIGPKMFCAGPNFLSQPKNLTAFSASSKTFVLAQKPILLNANHLFAGTKCLWLPQYVNKFLVWHKKFGPEQKILGPVKGEGIRNSVGHGVSALKWFQGMKVFCRNQWITWIKSHLSLGFEEIQTKL